MASIVNGQMQYQGGEAVPTMGTPEYNLAQKDPQSLLNFKAANPGLSFNAQDQAAYDAATPISANTSTVIPTGNIGTTTPMKVSPVPTPTGYTGLGGALEAQTANFTAQQQQDAQAQAEADKLAVEKSKVDSSKTALKDKIFGATTESGATNTAYKANGVDTAKQELNAINNQIISEQTSARRQIEQVQAQGGVGEGVNRKIAAIQKDSVSKQADLAVIQLAKQNNYFGAKEIADRQVKAALEQDQNEIDALKFDYQDNKENYTKAEQRQFDSMIKEKDRAYEEKKKNLELLTNTKLDLLKSATEQGAPLSTLQSIQSAQSPESAITLAGSYGGDQLRRLQIAKAQADLKKAGDDNQVLSVADAQKLGVPYGTTKAQAAAQGKVPGATSEANALKVSALDSAKALLQKFTDSKGLFGGNTAPVGINGILGTLPGTKGRDFSVQFDNLKALLSLDNVKYLKGQGQVSDSERRLLEQASSILNRSQSPAEFEKSLKQAITALSGTGDTSSSDVYEVNGTQYVKGADGLYYQK